jgi:hypothetical protein
MERYKGSDNLDDYASSMVVDLNGEVYVTGCSSTIIAPWAYDYATVKYDSAGIEKWVALYDASLGLDSARCISIDRNKNVYVSGTSSQGPETGWDYATIKYSQTPTWVPRNDENTKFEYKLDQNFPNPFNPITTISFDLPLRSNVEVSIFDRQGKKVEDLIDGIREAGTYEVIWDASGMPSGLYIYRLQAGDYTHSGKMMLLK